MFQRMYKSFIDIVNRFLVAFGKDPIVITPVEEDEFAAQ